MPTGLITMQKTCGALVYGLGITGAAIISIASLIFNSLFFWKYLSIYLSFEAFN
jgi:hypothetical protein